MATRIAIDTVGATGSLRDLTNSVQSSINAWKSQEMALKSSGDAIGASQVKYSGLGETIDRQKVKISELNARQESLISTSKENVQAFTTYEDKVAALRNQLQNLDTSTESGRQKSEQLKSEIERLGQEFQKSTGITEKDASAYLKLQKDINTAEKQLSSYESQQKRSKETMNYYTSGLAELQNGYKRTNAMSKVYVERMQAEGHESEANKAKVSGLRQSLTNLSSQYKIQSDELKNIASESGLTSAAYAKQKTRVDQTATSIAKLKEQLFFAKNDLQGLRKATDLAELYLPSNLVETSLIQDESHISADTSYTGMQFYNVNYAVPFEYTYATQTQAKQLIQHEQLLTNLSSVTKDLSAKVQNPTLINSKGEKFKIMLDDQGQLTAVNLAPAKVAIFGNSLTKNTGGIGMCATDQYHDWYYYFTQYLEQQNSAVTVNDRLNTSAWESATSTAERDQIFTTLMQSMLAPDTDLVILQLTDNVNTDAKKATYANDTKQLLKNVLSIAPKATIYWIVGWFGNQELYDQVQTACEQYDAHYLSIKDLNVVSNQGHLGDTITGIDGTTWQVTNPGAAAHPGNAGMKAIADRLISNLTF